MSDAALDGVPSLGGSPVIFIAVMGVIAVVLIVTAILICLYCRRRRRRKAALARASMGNNLNTLHPGPSLGGRGGRKQGSGFAPVSQMNDDEAFNAAPSPRHSMQYEGAYDPYKSIGSAGPRTGSAAYSNSYTSGGAKYDESTEVLATPTSTNQGPFSGGRPGVGASAGGANVGAATGAVAGGDAYGRANRAQRASASGQGRAYSGHLPTASYGSGFSDASYSAPPRREERSSYYGGVGAAAEPASDYLPPGHGPYPAYSANAPQSSSSTDQVPQPNSWTAYSSNANTSQDAPPTHDFGASGYAAEKQAHIVAHAAAASHSNEQSYPNPYGNESAASGPSASSSGTAASTGYPPQASSAVEPPSYDALSIDERSGFAPGPTSTVASETSSGARPQSEVMAAGPSRLNRASGAFPSGSEQQNKWSGADTKGGA